MFTNQRDPSQMLLLIGSSVGHSVSPKMHNSAARFLELPLTYEAVNVPKDQIAEAIATVRRLGVLGANITIPHKEAVCEMVDDLTDTARAVGAVNTLFWADDRLVGDNTDVAGFLAPLVDLNLSQQRVLLLGAGGAARAVTYALKDALSITVAARRPHQARELLLDLKIDGEAIELVEAPAVLESATIVINATPLGGPGLESMSPLEWPTGLASSVIAYDLLYKPLPTRFLSEAAEAGARTIDGRIMLREQASLSFERWTGHRFPTEVESP